MSAEAPVRLLAAAFTLALAVQAAALEPAAELLRRADAEKDLGAALRMLQAGLAGLKDPAERAQVLTRAAGISEAVSDVSAAQARYEEAYASLPGSETRPSLMRSAELLFEMGEYQKSEEQARLVLGQDAQPRMKKRAILLLARMMDRTGRGEEAAKLMRDMAELAGGESGDEKLLLFAVELGLARVDRSLLELALKKLDAHFSDTPAQLLARSLVANKPGPVAVYPVPSRIFPPAQTGLPKLNGAVAPEKPPAAAASPTAAPPAAPVARIRAIQLGSFTMEENARYLVRDLSAKGIKAAVNEEKRGGKTFYQVLVPLETARREPDEAQKELIRLKDKGFEGFFVFERPE